MNSALRGFISGPDFYASAHVAASLSPVPVNTSLVRDFCGETLHMGRNAVGVLPNNISTAKQLRVSDLV